ncbi:MAG TPA: DUF1343 domain-containing protein [Polyangiaceae bacterium]|jgi:uncharacterized protein YbbC (DUF1343 family)
MRTGLDRLAEGGSLAARLRGARFGLVAHPASVTRELVHVSRVLETLGARPRIIFGPEHGYGGEAQDMIGVADARDEGGVPVRSLYGGSYADLSPRARDLDDLDLVVIDLQDVGSRYYTFVWTAVLVMRACAARGVGVLVLDRPNPLGGTTLEGRAQEARFRSFVGLEPAAVRHGLTLGEIVAWRAEVEGVPAGLVEVVPALGLAREDHAPRWDRPFVPPSPNMPAYETALVYPGGCLIEGTNLSEGRGTTRPFELVGAPFLDGAALARGLRETDLPGFVARPVTFRPTFHKHAGQVCGGVQIHPTDPARFLPYATYLALVALAHRLARGAFAFRTEPYEFVADIPAFDLLTGNAEARQRIESGDDAKSVATDLSRTSSLELEISEEAIRAGAKAAI